MIRSSLGSIRHRGARQVVVLALVTALVGCTAPSFEPEETAAVDAPPERFTIVPDDLSVPYAGTAEDGRRFFLSDRLFASGPGGATYVGLFLWNEDGSFDELRVDEVPEGRGDRPRSAELLDTRLTELGDYVLEPIEVEPFTRQVEGVTFGWRVGRYEDGTFFIGIEPGDFIVYYEPWDGLEYDT